MVAESVGHLIAQGDKVIITCVGNGSIAYRLAALMNNTGKIYSFEALPNEIPKMKEKMKQLGVTS
jgi:tRNA A58 N-methylase Trm61